MTETQIVSAIQTRATVANSWLFTGARSTGISGLRATVTAPTCANNSCSLTLPNVGSLVFSLTDIEDLSLVDDTNLERFNSKTQSVMMDEGVTLIQSGTAARQSDGTQLAFQTYGGWLDNVVFGAERIEITENEIADVRLAGFSFGDATGTNPTGTSRAVWTGVFVGHDIERGIPIQGTAEVDIDDFDSPNVDLSIANVVDINSTASTAGSKFVNVTDMTLTDGTFTDVDGVVRGSFYGSGHTQVGGVVDNAGAWIGAFGGTRQ